MMTFDVISPINKKKSKYNCNLLDKLAAAIKEKWIILANRKGVMFHHDNTSSHKSKMRTTKKLALGWEVLNHSTYSTDLPSTPNAVLGRSVEYHSDRKKRALTGRHNFVTSIL
jgi:hypothetical protein